MAERLVKVRFELDSSDWHGHGSETLCAAPIAGGPRTFRLLNSPFFTTGVSHQDLVAAAPTDDGLIFAFEEVVERSGHSTYMLIVETEAPRFPAHWDTLERMGCSYESMHMKFSMGRRLLLSVDVPPSADLFAVHDVLKRGEADTTWLFQEGYAHQGG